MESAQDWVDGFLVVGNQPVLDLLNTRLLVGDEEKEMLADTAALVRWVKVAGMAEARGLQERLESWGEGPEARSFLAELRMFREELWEAVERMEEGRTPTDEFLERLSERMFRHPMRRAMAMVDGVARSVQAEGTSVGDTLWAALLQETERLLTEVEPGRVRRCEGCVVHFVDVSKKNARRWCSMRLCGNRVKVAAYQGRRRAGVAE